MEAGDIQPQSDAELVTSTAMNADKHDDPGTASLGKSDKSGAARAQILHLYRYADRTDAVLLLVGTLFAAGQGVALPCTAILFGDSMDASAGNTSGKSYVEMMRSVLTNLGLLAVGISVAGFVWQTCFRLAAARQAARMRADYFHKILTRDVSFFDTTEPASLPTRMANEAQVVQDAIGAKMGQCIVSGAQFIAGLVVAFMKGWELTLVLCLTIPLIGACGVYSGKQVTASQSQQQAWFGRAGAVAEESFAAMRVVAAFGGEQRAVEHFEVNLKQARRGGIIAGCNMGLAFGMILSCFALLYALTFWYGAHHMIANARINTATGEPYEGSDIVMVLLAVILGFVSLNDLAAPLMAVAQGVACIGEMRRVMDAESAIESCARSEESLPAQASTLERIEFVAVEFAYPSRPEHKILKGLDLIVQRGQKVALVGESGSGKSTVIQLLERFYDPLAGKVLINGMDLKALPLAGWRKLVGYVGQEPVLFATSILENIKGGNPKFTTEEVEAAARQANAMEFIEALPRKLKTSVGVGGGQLSGGQKQRIAIARALVKRPQLLLLDEATSALDNESEKQVQATVDALQGSDTEALTTISVAHRLSTIRNSNVIFVVKAGKVVEKGAHDELMQVQGEYYALVQSQGAAEPTESDSDATESSSRCSGGCKAGEDAVQGTGRSSLMASISNWRGSLRGSMRGSVRSSMRGSVRSNARGSVRSSLPPVSDKEMEQMRIRALQDMRYKTPWGRLLKLAMPQWFLFPLASLGVLLAGAGMPLSGFLLSRAISGFYETCDGLPMWTTAQTVHECPDAMLEQMNSICLYFVLVAVGTLLGESCKYASFAYIQEGLAMRLRSRAFKSLVRQDLEFFDDPANGPGGLTTTLARSTSLVAQMAGISAGNLAAALVSLITGLSLAFVGSWKLALAILAAVPCLCIAMLIVVRTTMGGRAGSGDGSENYSISGEIASEAILNIRTVRALMAEQQCMQGFVSVVSTVAAQESKRAPLQGFAFGFGSGIIYVVYILGFGYGAVLADEGLEPKKMYQAIMCTMLSVMGASFAVTLTTDSAKGKLAAHDVFAAIDRESKIDAVVPEGSHRSLGDGSIEFRDVRFKFPHSKNTVLRRLSFHVSARQTVALVGPSGSGKSTVIQLLQRFYDPASGSVLVGGEDLRSFDVAWWRQQVGFVGQEPILFNVSLEENVRYGNPGATQEQLIAAAERANMDFVLDGKVGWGDVVGTRGGKLSGGQKQRCAIARALLRDPRVLLLDEATSALDSTSERVVQAALDKAREGRTTFTVAHRLSTVRDSDLILVVRAGVVVESGRHDELVKLGGLYCSLETLGKQ